MIDIASSFKPEEISLIDFTKDELLEVIRDGSSTWEARINYLQSVAETSNLQINDSPRDCLIFIGAITQSMLDYLHSSNCVDKRKFTQTMEETAQTIWDQLWKPEQFFPDEENPQFSANEAATEYLEDVYVHMLKNIDSKRALHYGTIVNGRVVRLLTGSLPQKLTALEAMYKCDESKRFITITNGTANPTSALPHIIRKYTSLGTGPLTDRTYPLGIAVEDDAITKSIENYSVVMMMIGMSNTADRAQSLISRFIRIGKFKEVSKQLIYANFKLEP